MYRTTSGRLEVLLVHPGGPFWRRKDLGAWTIPKGEYGPDEDPLGAARREFQEETGRQPHGPFLPLAAVKQAGGKAISAWAFEDDWDPAQLHSNTFTVEWPKGSRKFQTCPEVDRAQWFDLPEARRRINPAQVAWLEELERRISSSRHRSASSKFKVGK
jgi:predicted NUDIX family NTP pyrophosphohydrolase